MRYLYRLVMAALLFFSLGLAQAEEPGSLLGSMFLEHLSPAQINQAMARLYPRGTTYGAGDAVDHYRIRYSSRDENGEPVEIIAQLFIPIRQETVFLPLYVMGVGTTGLSEECAPSLEVPSVSNWGDYPAHMLSYATQGYIAILPDPVGFNDPERVPRYFIAEASAHVLLDAARAVYNFFEEAELAVRPAEAVFMAGYSQGGHAVFAASDYAASYAPDVPLRGVIGYGPTTDVADMLLANPYFGPYLVYAYSQVYGGDRVDPAELLQAHFAQSLEADVLGHCVDEIFNYYGADPQAIYSPGFLEALRTHDFEGDYASFGGLLVENSSGLTGSDVPALILQGTSDTVVFPSEQEAFIAQACAAGERITYVSYANVDHFQTRQFGYRDTLSWIQGVLGGSEPRSDCSRFVAQ